MHSCSHVIASEAISDAVVSPRATFSFPSSKSDVIPSSFAFLRTSARRALECISSRMDSEIGIISYRPKRPRYPRPPQWTHVAELCPSIYKNKVYRFLQIERKAHFFRGGMDSTIINYNNVYINS